MLTFIFRYAKAHRRQHHQDIKRGWRRISSRSRHSECRPRSTGARDPRIAYLCIVMDCPARSESNTTWTFDISRWLPSLPHDDKMEGLDRTAPQCTPCISASGDVSDRSDRTWKSVPFYFGPFLLLDRDMSSCRYWSGAALA